MRSFSRRIRFCYQNTPEYGSQGPKYRIYRKNREKYKKNDNFGEKNEKMHKSEKKKNLTPNGDPWLSIKNCKNLDFLDISIPL